MFELFDTLFKYKEKRQKDSLGHYPEKVNVRAFPERRYLWTSRFFVVVSCISLCLSMILGGLIIILIPMKKVNIMPLHLDEQRYQMTVMEHFEDIAFAGDLVTEGLMRKYIINRYTINDNLDEMNKRWGENEYLHLTSDSTVYSFFTANERVHFEGLYNKGVRRKVSIDMVYPVSFDFWQVRFRTIDTIPGEEQPFITKWTATLRMTFNFAKYEDKSLGLINPFGLTIISYDLAYNGNNRKNKR